jgi:hypothetical protein
MQVTVVSSDFLERCSTRGSADVSGRPHGQRGLRCPAADAILGACWPLHCGPPSDDPMYLASYSWRNALRQLRDEINMLLRTAISEIFRRPIFLRPDTHG